MGKTKKNTFKTTSVYVTASLSLILFLLLVFGSVFIQSQKVFNKYKEQIEIDVFFRDATSEADIKKLEKEVLLAEGVKAVKYVSKEDAWEVIKKDIDLENVEDLLGGIPLRNSLQLKLAGDYVQIDSVKQLENYLMNRYDKEIMSVSYNEIQFQNINQNFYTYMLYVLGLCGLLVIIAIVLINNTIRLAIFSKRFLIRTMQLVGAKRSFIKKPFIINAIFQGIFSGIIAIIFFIGLSYLLSHYESFFSTMLFTPQNLIENLFLFSIVIFLGVLISYLSTSLSVSRYLKLSIDKLYRF